METSISRTDHETRQRAVRVASKLSPTARGAVSVAREINGRRALHPAAGTARTRGSLVKLGIASRDSAIPGEPAYLLTDFGRVVHAVVVKGAAAVLAETERKDTEQRAPMRQQPQQQHQATDERPNATETARKAIAVYKKLSPTMRDAVRGAARSTPTGALRIGWTGQGMAHQERIGRARHHASE